MMTILPSLLMSAGREHSVDMDIVLLKDALH
jgi:hypothetical protein